MGLHMEYLYSKSLVTLSYQSRRILLSDIRMYSCIDIDIDIIHKIDLYYMTRNDNFKV